MASKEDLLNSISPYMKLTKDFFKRIYGYEITYPGFKDIALSKLRNAGCTKAEDYYEEFVAEHEKQSIETLKEVAKWYIEYSRKEVGKEIERKQQRGVQRRVFNGFPQDW